ncbi:hypothetical protein ABZX92_12650 [Lentzea sp. NPDC006480]|uniref:hypothetical protein n=1 Tax=Lentzea sp. NPDC006480 TaxID=3157176 RepID=UPI0033B71732
MNKSPTESGRRIGMIADCLMLLVLMAAPPWALAYFIGWPLPDHLPTRSEFWDLVQRPMSTGFLLNLSACLGWLLWFWLAAGVFAAAASELSGTGKELRKLSTVLVGSIVLSVLGNRTPATAISAPSAETVTLPLPNEPPLGTVEVIEEVLPPQHDGAHTTYDSLWHVAHRMLGDGTRWPELFELNRGVVQPDGLALTDPDNIRPGWKIKGHVPQPPPDLDAQPTTEVASEPPPALDEQPLPIEPAVSTSTGAFVAIGLATAVSGAIVSARVWRRRRYRPGSRDRRDLEHPQGPIVRALRIAHDLHPEPDLRAEPQATAVGIRDGHEIILDLAAANGIGFVGPGAPPALRALLIHLVANGRNRIILTSNDLLGEQTMLPSAIKLVPDLDAVTEVLQQEPECAVLVTNATPECEEHVQAALASGAVVLLLGQWQRGGTIRVRADGTVSATTPDLHEQLSEAKLFSLPAAESAELLELFHAAEGGTEPAVESATTKPLLVRVLGDVRLVHRAESGERDLTNLLTNKHLELLAYLAVHHPRGARLDAVIEALWPDAPVERPRNSLHNLLSRLRRALAETGAADVVQSDKKGRLMLAPDRVDTDLAIVKQAGFEELAGFLRLYAGDFAEDCTSAWVEPFRESVRRDLLDALADLSRGLAGQPEKRLALLEQIRRLDRYNESVYRDILTVQAELGQLDSVPRTLALLRTELAELDHCPSPETVALADALSTRSLHAPKN